MALKIIFQPPPNYAEILAVFPHAARAGVFFCYGRAIWNPSGATISPSLMAHETVHADRQASDPDGWWKKYLADEQFRFDEELPAHIAEFRLFEGKSRNERRFMLRQISQRLSGRLYDSLCTTHRAKQLITGKRNPDAA